MHPRSVPVTELIGIFHTIMMVIKIAHQFWEIVDGGQSTATILYGSRSALQTIQNTRNKPGQPIFHAILQAASEVQPYSDYPSASTM